jgi:hypothetical protein
MDNVYGGDWEIQQTPTYPLDISISGPDGQTEHPRQRSVFKPRCSLVYAHDGEMQEPGYTDADAVIIFSGLSLLHR